mgnify:CR=1 FL=1
MAVTRINNNQITTAVSGNAFLGINAASKLQNYSITSNKIANSLVYGSDLTISGNLVVLGTQTTVDSTTVTINDLILIQKLLQYKVEKYRNFSYLTHGNL